MSKYEGLILPTLPEDRQKDKFTRDMHIFFENMLRILKTNPANIIYVEATPNGDITALRGTIALWNNGGTRTSWINIDGGTTWQQLDEDTATFLGLLDTPATYAAQAGKHLRVNATPDGIEFFLPTFLELADSPVNYTGSANKYVKVNGTPDAVGFAIPTFIEASDTPVDYSGAASKFVKVNAGGNALEFVALTPGDMSYSDTRFTVIHFTRSMTAASGNVAITGAGFTPKLVMFFAGISAVPLSTYFGATDATTSRNIFNNATFGADVVEPSAGVITLKEAGGTQQFAVLASFDADGFTLTWTKTGVPAAGTAQVTAIAVR